MGVVWVELEVRGGGIFVLNMLIDLKTLMSHVHALICG